MIVKAVRVRTASGAGPLARHLLDGEDNEAVDVIQGNVADLHDAVADAKRFNRVYAVRHFIVAPALALDRGQFHQAVDVLASEFGFDATSALVVEHRKSRAVVGAAETHWHIVVAEVDGATGRVLSSAHDRSRHEKVARTLEVLFGHPVVSGPHDLAVLAALRRDGRDDIADHLAGQLGVGPRPVEAFSTKQHQAAKRGGTDLAQVRTAVRRAWADSANGDDLRGHLAGHGLTLSRGDKPGTWIVRSAGPNAFLGAAHRLVGVLKAEFNALIERTDNEHHPDDRRSGDIERHAGAAARRANDPLAGEGHGPADGRRGSEFPRGDDRSVADDRQRGGTESPGHRGVASEAGRTGARAGAAAYDGRGLTEAFQHAAASLSALCRGDVGTPFALRADEHLAGIEAQAQAQIAAAQNLPSPSQSRLDAARLYEKGTTQRHAELMRQYRTVEAALAEPMPSPSVLDRMLGRRPTEASDRAALEREYAGLRAELITSERQAASATAAVGRAEKDHSAACAARQVEAEGMARRGQELLAQVATTRRMVTVYPGVVWSGPAFVGWAGQKVERRRRRAGLRNPLARTIWGLPIEYGP